MDTQLHTQTIIILLEYDDHAGYKIYSVFKSEQNWEISQKYAHFFNFGPPFWILNELRFSLKTIQQRPLPKWRYFEILKKDSLIFTHDFAVSVRSSMFPGMTS